MLIPHTIDEICKKNNLSFAQNRSLFYKSELYKMLIDDDTKLWHLSAQALSMLFISEQTTGKFQIFEESCA
jgi:hypothetical protein